MKLYDIKIATKDRENVTHWRTIGTVFASDDAKLIGSGGKPLGFSIDYPTAQGIVVPRKKKMETASAIDHPDDERGNYPENTEE